MKVALPILLFLISILQISAQDIDKNINEIRQIYTQTNAKIAEGEKDFAMSEIFFTELVVNKGGTSYPAVGTYKQTVNFYHTYGDREKEPYPNRLLKITVSTQSAPREMSAEFLFDPKEHLIFYFAKDLESENRLYFAGGKLIRWQKDKKLEDIKNSATNELLKEAICQKNRFVNIFRNSL